MDVMSALQKMGKILLFLLLGICLTLSITFSLLLFGLDQTLYSWRFFSHRLSEFGTVLTSELVHKSLVKALINPMTRSLGNNVPPRVKFIIEEAALTSFTGPWFVETGTDAVKSVQAVLKRKSSTLDFYVSLQTFKDNFGVILYRSGQFKPQEIEGGLREIPDQLDPEELLPAELNAKILRIIRTYPVYSNTLMYGLPLLFCVLCFLLGSFKNGVITVGISFFAGSTLIQAARLFLLHKSSLVAGLFLNSKSIQTFEVPLRAGMADFSDYLVPALVLAYLGAFFILGGGLLLERALRRGDVLNYFNKLKKRKKGKRKTLPWS